MQKLEHAHLGSFEVVSEDLRISDPCYKEDTWCAGVVNNVKQGKWSAVAVKSDESPWGNRVACLIAYFDNENDIFPDYDAPDWVDTGIPVGVDSGQAGIFDIAYYKDDESVKDCERFAKDEQGLLEIVCEDDPWYSICCDRTLCDTRAGVIPYGVVSSSGYGDGEYRCYTITENGKVTAVKISFGLLEDEEDEDKEIEKYSEDWDTLQDLVDKYGFEGVQVALDRM